MTTASRVYTDMIDDLVRDLTGPGDHRRASAVDSCAGLPEDLLIEIIPRALRRYHRLAAWRWMAFLLGITGLVSVAYAIQGEPVLLFGGVNFMIAARHLLCYRHAGRSLQALLTTSEDTRVVQLVLLDLSPKGAALSRPHLARMRDAALTQLLPFVSEREDEMWSRRMRRQLTALLKVRDEELRRSVLLALAQIGDEEALPAVRQLTCARQASNGHCSAPIGGSQVTIHDAAERCINAIVDRVRRRSYHALLLRPCHVESSVELLLPRPSSAAGNDDELLMVYERAVKAESG